jgi:mannose-6-phosphate isomerase-like protein (cupin superfamily)
MRATGSHLKLKKGQKFKTAVKAEGEQLLFVWKGALKVKSGGKEYAAGERDTVFIQGAAELEVTSTAPSEIIQVQAP